MNRKLNKRFNKKYNLIIVKSQQYFMKIINKMMINYQ